MTKYDILSGIGIINTKAEPDYSGLPKIQTAPLTLEELPVTEQEACEAGIPGVADAYDENGVRTDIAAEMKRQQGYQDAYNRYVDAMTKPDEERPRALRGLGTYAADWAARAMPDPSCVPSTKPGLSTGFYMRRAHNGGWLISNNYEDIPLACFASTGEMLEWLKKELRNYA